MMKSQKHTTKLRRSTKRYNLTPRYKKKYRIAVLMSDYGIAQKAILDGFKSEMSKLLPNQGVIDIFNAGGTSDAILDSNTARALEGGYDVLFPIGLLSARSAQRLTAKEAQKTPVVFTGVDSPVAHKLVKSYERSGNNLTGFSVESPSRFVPVFLLLMIEPNAKTFFVPYREDAGKNPHFMEELENTRNELAKVGITLTLYPFKDDRISRELYEEMKKHDAVVVPEGGVTTRDRDYLVSYAEIEKIPTHAGGKDAVGMGAIFGVTSDMVLIGRRAVEVVIKIARDGVKPTDIPIEKIKNTRSVSCNPDKFSQYGVSFASEVIGFCETVTAANELTPTHIQDLKLFAAYAQNDSVLSKAAIKALTERFSTQVTSEYGKLHKNDRAAFGSEVVEQEDMETSLTRILQRPYIQGVVIAGAQAIDMTHDLMHRLDRHRTLYTFEVASSLKNAVGLQRMPQIGCSKKVTVVEPMSPVAVAGGLKAFVRSKLKHAYNIVTYDKEHLPPGTDEFLAYLEAAGAKFHYKIETVFLTTQEALEAHIAKHSHARNAHMGFPHLMSDAFGVIMARHAQKCGVPVVAPSDACADLVPFSIKSLTATLSYEEEHFDEHAIGVKVRFISARTAYHFKVNDEALKALGIDPEIPLARLLEYQLEHVEEKRTDGWRFFK